MIWYRMQVGFVTHPKMLSLTLSQRWAWLTLLDHCSQHDNDGRLPRLVLKRLHVSARITARYVELGLLEPDPNAPDGESYIVHNWQAHNSRDYTAAARQQRHREKTTDTENATFRSPPDADAEQKHAENEPQDTSAQAKKAEMSRVTPRAPAETETVQEQLQEQPPPDPPPRRNPANGRPEGAKVSDLEPIAKTLAQQLEVLAAGGSLPDPFAVPAVEWDDV